MGENSRSNAECDMIICRDIPVGEPSWVVDLQKQAQAFDIRDEKERWSIHSIYRVPEYIKKNHKDAYTPQVVSFGPYHHTDPALAAMEVHKSRSLMHFLRRSNQPLENLVGKMRKMKAQLMLAYDGLFDEPPEGQRKWYEGDQEAAEEEFLKMMMVDGCFMLEVIQFQYHVTKKARNNSSAKDNDDCNDDKYADYGDNDPIFSSHGVGNVLPLIRRDMLMMENQLPLLVLYELATAGTRRGPDGLSNNDTVNKMVVKFLGFADEASSASPSGLHPLDLYRKCLLPDKQLLNRQPRNTECSIIPKMIKQLCSKPKSPEPNIVRSATELHEAGITFKCNKHKRLTDIDYRDGVLRLPRIVVDDLTECTLLNVMAFERLHAEAKGVVTAYACFMDNIINSPADISLLHSNKILYNAVGSDEEAAQVFNTLSKDVILDPSLDVHNPVNEYCNKKWNKWMTNLKHTYFHNPWVALSLAVAVFLLVLTVAQTVFTVLQWHDAKAQGHEG